MRNKLAHTLGYEDYYDYKINNTEGFGKDKLFEMLDGLERGTRTIMVAARQKFASQYGEDGLEPWNISHKMSGSIVAKMDPYFPFAKAVQRYMQSYGALHITYEGATMNLDLLDRPKKYSNGFYHWPRVAWQPRYGQPFIPSVANLTSLADPVAVGCGLIALRTLMHEAGVRCFIYDVLSSHTVPGIVPDSFRCHYLYSMPPILQTLSSPVHCLVKSERQPVTNQHRLCGKSKHVSRLIGQ